MNMTAPAITPSTGVPKSAADAVPPIGSRGLPFTWTFSDWPSDTPPFVNPLVNTNMQSTTNRMALFDEALWKTRQMNAQGVSGTSIQFEPLAPTASIVKANYTQATGLQPFNPRTDGARVRGAGINQSPPSLNHGRGSLVFSSTINGVSKSIHDASKVRGSAQYQGLSFSNCGRFVDHPEENYASARPANHSWSKPLEGFQYPYPTTAFDQPQGNGQKDNNIETDHAVGGVGDGSATCTDPQFVGLQTITSTVVKTVSAIPSNGLGSIYGDSHNSVHYTNLVCSNLANDLGNSITASNGGITPVASYEYTRQTHWCINLGTAQTALKDGVEASSPDGLTKASVWQPTNFTATAWDTNTASAEMSQANPSAVLSSKTETIQQIVVKDTFSTGSGGQTPIPISTLGDITLGASVVHDTAGLIGFEGTITASAFYSPTKDTDPTGVQGAIAHASGKGYAGLNVQVHSGFGIRRNKGGMGKYGNPYKYGSDGTPVRVMTDAMKTYARRGDGTEGTADANCNETWFRTGTIGANNSATPSSNPDGIPEIGFIGAKPAPESAFAHVPIGQTPLQMGGTTTTKIIGANMPANLKCNEIHNSYSTGKWIADGVPTKVQIIPVITGYEDVQVSVGASKLVAFPSAPTQTFRKPLVDYHILVSITDSPETKANTDPTNPFDGITTQRNVPDPQRLSANADYQKQGCVIYHSIFRIDPQTLEQIFIDVLDMSAANYMMNADGGAICPSSVIPRHDYAITSSTGRMTQGWNLHQATPFRPLSLSDKLGKVPRLGGAIEGGGFYQRGGISHLWDGCEYGGEIFVGADCIKPHELQESSADSTNKFGQPTFGIFGNGQIWADGTGAPKRPTGMELFIWRYSPQDDPLYPSQSEGRLAMSGMTNGVAKIGGLYNASMDNISPTALSWHKPRTGNLEGAVWAIHDWVMPQVELMRYLGREEKTEAEHYEVSGSHTYHPSLHCSSLRAMDDGRFMMAAVHVDYIKTEADYPTNEISYPLNPDLDVATCPAGYYYSGGKCIPLTGTGDSASGFSPDPQSGDQVPQSNQGQPAPVNGTGSSTPNKQDNFSLHPTWSKMKANTQARSLIMMFSDVKSDKSTGLATRGKALFDIEWNKVSVGDGATQTIATQNWNYGDTWWSGSRISYWYQESGQRAIPITYGSYPDCRMSYGNLPRSLPFLVNEFPDSGVLSSKARIASGFPMLQPAVIALNMPLATPSVFQNNLRQDASQLVWTLQREKHLKLTRFVPTTIGFADFGAGANPHQEYGWSGWSFPRGLYDPMGYGNNDVFFSDSPEADLVPFGTLVAPTQQAIFRGLGQSGLDDDDPSSTNPLSPQHGYSLDLSGVSFPVVLESIIIYKTGTGQEKLLSTQTCGSVAEIVAVMLNPTTSNYPAIDQEYINMGEPPMSVSSSFTGIERTFTLNNMPPNEQLGVMNFEFIILSGVKYYFQRNGASGARLLRGGVGGWSHHGALHYGISTKLHPYRVDRVMKQVHGGVGYDLPLHLLKPPKAHVRARAGSTNSIELELETPFHRTDNIHLLGATNFNSGFNLGGESPPNAPRPVMGQYYLRTNLWDKPLYGEGGSKAPLVAPLTELNSRVHGPIISGSQALEAFWSDHPTDHFHASAMPILPNSDYDLAMIEQKNYSPMMLAHDTNDLDVLALGEQLESSVDVHVSKTAKPYWDSGAIVSAQGEGYRGNKANHMIQTSAMMNGLDINNGGSNASQYALGSQEMSMGMGQRSVRTPDGTLHQFHIRRSAQAGSENLPQWTHYKKPLYGDVFWNSKAAKPNPASAIHAGHDEVGPLLNSIGANGDGTANSLGKVMGAAFCSDSNGTIHAVIEIHASSSAGHKAHRLYYHRCERKAITYNPEPVYDWDWTVNAPVLIQNAAVSTYVAGSMYDLRQPTIACDSADRIHLACVQISQDMTVPRTRILYTCKLAGEPSFPEFLPTNTGSEGMPEDRRWQLVQNAIVDASQTTLNSETASFHYTTFNQEPKIVLRGDNVPLVFYRGKPMDTFATVNRRHDAIYCNIGKAPSGNNDPSGAFVFDPTTPCHVVGLRPDSKNPMEDFNVQYYDAIIDEKDIAYVVSTKNDYDFTDAHAPRQTLMTFFDTNKTFAEQYTTTDGLGTHLTIWQGKEYTTAGDAKVDSNYRDLTLTTNGKGEIHLIMTFTMTGDDPDRFGETFRDAATPQVRQSALAPLQWAATPSGDLTGVSETPYIGGFVKPTISPNWTGQITPPMPPYKATNPNRREHNHIMHIWIPSVEFDATNHVLRSMNIRWLSVPSIRWDNTAQSWIPVGSAQTMAGEEDFPHHSPQIRYQRFWGFDASELDLRWHTNELSWYRTNTVGSDVYFPSAGGVQMQLGTGQESGQGVAGFPNGL